MNTFLRIGSAVVLASAALVVGTGPLGCSDDGGSGTTGRRVSLDVKIAASPESKQFTNAKGWSVTLTKAVVATGAFYFYDGETLFAGNAPRGRSGWGLINTALAHPGHYVPGNAKGEMLTPSSADLLAGGTLGNGDGVTGLVRSATFSYGSPPAGPLASELGASLIVLEGTATKDAESRIFRAEIDAEELKDTKGFTQIEGCPFAATDMQSDGTVAITVKLPMWFDQVDFNDEPKSIDGKPVLLPAGLARNQLVRGTKAGLAYTFAFQSR
jgi:hypothetical protein